MKMAQTWGELSHCERKKVGALIVKDRMIISDGYNGTPSGFENECEEDQVRYYENPDHAQVLIDKGYECSFGCCSKTVTRREVLHAESNAIMKVAKSTMSCEGAELYTTTCPCFDCAKLIIQAGISKVYYSEDYRDMTGVELLKKANIEVEEVICWNDL